MVVCPFYGNKWCRSNFYKLYLKQSKRAVASGIKLECDLPVGMQRALNTHNAIIRRCAARNMGFEVKTTVLAVIVSAIPEYF